MGGEDESVCLFLGMRSSPERCHPCMSDIIGAGWTLGVMAPPAALSPLYCNLGAGLSGIMSSYFIIVAMPDDVDTDAAYYSLRIHPPAPPTESPSAMYTKSMTYEKEMMM